MMRKLGDRVLYTDTDSVIFLSRPGDEAPVEGDMLGEWNSQLEPGESHIVEYLSLGPKTYYYKTDKNRIELAAKGIPQNLYTEDILRYDDVLKKYVKTGESVGPGLFKELLLGGEQLIVYPDSLKRDGKNQTIKSVVASKTLRKTYTKRFVLSDFTTLPYGTKK